ncbi:MAG: hypothetical protein MJE66_21595 [Proteobacteria bacterium]|nr:hypothetical protein [Pseudomonadota bacterium]
MVFAPSPSSLVAQLRGATPLATPRLPPPSPFHGLLELRLLGTPDPKERPGVAQLLGAPRAGGLVDLRV